MFDIRNPADVRFLIFAEGQPFTNELGVDPLGHGTDIDEVVDAFR